MSDYRTKLEAKVRSSLYPLLDSIFSADLSDLAISLAGSQSPPPKGGGLNREDQE